MAIPSPQVISAVDTVSDQRLDIDGTVWQLSTNTNESVILYGIQDNAGNDYEIGYLKERPAVLNFYGNNAAPAVSGETEVTTLGAIDTDKFYVDYDRAFILFPDGRSSPVNVTYRGMGSIQKAIDVNAALATGQSASLAENWATKFDGVVANGEYSAKEYAIGTTVAAGSAKDWAVLPENSVVDGGTGYSALHWAAKAEGHYDNFDDRYLGAKSSAPSVDNDNQTLIAGALYFNSSDSTMYVRSSGSAWVQATSVNPVSMTVYKYIATANQTSFSGADANSATLAYTAANINVYLNGVRLDETDYTATNGTSVVLDDGALVDDELVVIAFRAFQSSRYVDATGGTFTGAVTFGAGLTANTADINGGTFDGIVGGTTPAAGRFTTITTEDGLTTEGGLVAAGGALTQITAVYSNNEGDLEMTAAGAGIEFNESTGIGSLVKFTTTGTLPTGLAIDTIYYVVDYYEDDFTVSLKTPAEQALESDIIQYTNAGTGTHYVQTVTLDVTSSEIKASSFTGDFTGRINDLTIKSSAVYNIGLGFWAVDSITTGDYNTGVGIKALKNCTEGDYNVAVGVEACEDLTEGDYNTGIGSGTLANTTEGDRNTGIGAYALSGNTDGQYNTALGYRTLSDTSGSYNTGLGYQAGDNITTGSSNIMIGANVDADSATASNQLNIGGAIKGDLSTNAITLPGTLTVTGALTAATLDTGQGANELYDMDQNVKTDSAVTFASINTIPISGSAGSESIAIGTGALGDASGADSCVGIGHEALDLVTSGDHNIGIGYRASRGDTYGLTTGNYNICIGHRAGYSMIYNSNNIMIGKGTGPGANNADHAICIGEDTRANARGISIGHNSGSTGSDVVKIGKSGNYIQATYTSSGTWSQSSDIRKKTDIVDNSLGLNFIDALRTVNFKWRPAEEHPEEWEHFTDELDGDGNLVKRTYADMDTETLQYGMIAQEVKEAMTNAGADTFDGWSETLEGCQNIGLASFVLPLIKAVQELSAQVKTLTAKVTALESA